MKPPLLQRAAVVLATGLGAGCAPVASGTVGTFWGVLLVLALHPLLPWTLQVPVYLLLALAAVPLCGAAEKYFGKKDDGRIVADEFMTFPISLIGLPLQGWVLVLAFITNRACDIIKPPPARALQRLPGGWGIVIDDVVAALYSLALNHAAYWLAGRWGVL